MEWIQECMLAATLKPPVPVGEGPIGTRVYYEINEGRVSGDRLNGKILGGGEWALIGPDGYLRVDVRLQIETDDGAFIYGQYGGLLEMNEKVVEAIGSGGETRFEDQHFYTNPRFETGDPRYSWLNTTFFVGEGRMAVNTGVEYRVWRPA